MRRQDIIRRTRGTCRRVSGTTTMTRRCWLVRHRMRTSVTATSFFTGGGIRRPARATTSFHPMPVRPWTSPSDLGNNWEENQVNFFVEKSWSMTLIWLITNKENSNTNLWIKLFSRRQKKDFLFRFVSSSIFFSNKKLIKTTNTENLVLNFSRNFFQFRGFQQFFFFGFHRLVRVPNFLQIRFLCSSHFVFFPHEICPKQNENTLD